MCGATSKRSPHANLRRRDSSGFGHPRLSSDRRPAEIPASGQPERGRSLRRSQDDPDAEVRHAAVMAVRSVQVELDSDSTPAHVISAPTPWDSSDRSRPSFVSWSTNGSASSTPGAVRSGRRSPRPAGAERAWGRSDYYTARIERLNGVRMTRSVPEDFVENDRARHGGLRGPCPHEEPRRPLHI